MEKILPDLCLKEIAVNHYHRKNMDYDPYITVEPKPNNNGLFQIHSKIRGKKIELKPIKIKNKDINKVFVKMLKAASTIKHPSYIVEDIIGLNFAAFNMVRFGMIPKNLLVSSAIKIPELNEETFTVQCKGHTCSSILNNCIGGTFILNILKFESKKMEVYILSTPKICGLFKHNEEGVRMLIRPSSCMKIEFTTVKALLGYLPLQSNKTLS